MTDLPNVKKILIYQDSDSSGNVSNGDAFKVIEQNQACFKDDELDLVTCSNLLYDSVTTTYFIGISEDKAIDEVLKQRYDAIRIISPQFRLSFKDGKSWEVAAIDTERYIINNKFVQLKELDDIIGGVDHSKVEDKFLEGLSYMHLRDVEARKAFGEIISTPEGRQLFYKIMSEVLFPDNEGIE